MDLIFRRTSEFHIVSQKLTKYIILTILRRYSLIYNQCYLSWNELTKHKGVYFILADSVLLWFYLEKQQKIKA